MLVHAGLLTPDAPLEAYLREASDLPSPDPSTARETDARPPAPTGTPAASGGVHVAAHTRRAPGRRRGAPKTGELPLWDE